jgi:deoxyadenosine/deoxycytidine kinase
LTGPDYDVFTAVYEHTSGSLALPDVAVYLELGIDHTLERIRARDRPYERGIDPDYIRRLADAYAARMDDLGRRVERVAIEPAWTPERVAEAVAQAAGLTRSG